jgi:hypothetical protein
VRTIRVNAADGTDWRVRVVWRPRWAVLAGRLGAWRRNRRRARRGDVDPADGVVSGLLDNVWDNLLVGIIVVFAVVVFSLLFWWLLLPLLLVAVDAVVVVILLVLVIPARVLFRRPWTVEAATGSGAGEEWFATQVVGWREALHTRDEIADKLRAGYPAPVVGSLRRGR